MPRTILLPCFLGAALLTHAQPGTVRPAPAWKAGDMRQVDVKRTIQLTVDSSSYNLSVHAVYALEVISAKDEEYVLAVKTLATDQLEAEAKLQKLASGKKPNDLDQFKQTTMEGLYKPLGGLPTQFNITTEGEITGQRDAVSAVEKLRPDMARPITDMVAAIENHKHLSPGPLPKARINFLTDSSYTILTKPPAHELNRLMRVYAIAFPFSGSRRERITVKGVVTPLQREFKELPAIVETDLDEQDRKHLTCRTIIIYDRDSLQAALAHTGAVVQAKPGSTSMTEERVDVFDRSKGWPTSSTSELEFRHGTTWIHVSSKSVFTVLH